MPDISRHGVIEKSSGAGPLTPPEPGAGARVYYGYWIILAGFVTQFVSVGMANYVVGAFMIPMT
jgi:hypothetical protein